MAGQNSQRRKTAEAALAIVQPGRDAQLLAMITDSIPERRAWPSWSAAGLSAILLGRR